MTVRIKRAYELADPTDGKRVLVDRLWPRGLSKERAQVDVWMKEVAPSPELRKWFGHQPELFDAFSKQYESELKEDPLHIENVKELEGWALQGNVTLLYAAKDPACNHALVLQKVLMKI